MPELEQVTMPLSRSELAIAELGEMLARGLTPDELRDKGWDATASLMEQRRRLILEAEIARRLLRPLWPHVAVALDILMPRVKGGGHVGQGVENSLHFVVFHTVCAPISRQSGLGVSQLAHRLHVGWLRHQRGVDRPAPHLHVLL